MLKGWQVTKREPSGKKCNGKAWLCDIPGPLLNECLLGLTNPPLRVTVVESRPFSKGSLAHELAHVFSIKSGDVDSHMHCDWEGRGIKKALLDLTREPDGSESGKGCFPKHALP
jgi:hypothetical protein